MKNSQRASKRAMELLYHVSPTDYVPSFSPRDFTGSGVWGRPKASNFTPWHSILDDFGLEVADYACHDGLHRVGPPLSSGRVGSAGQDVVSDIYAKESVPAQGWAVDSGWEWPCTWPAALMRGPVL